MTISETAKRLGLSPHTLRYYEKIGLIRDVERASGRRVYTDRDLIWLEFVLRLKATGMSLARIKRYADLRYKGDGTVSKRKAMLLSHRQDLESAIDRLTSNLVALDHKIELYEAMEKEHDTLRKRTEEA
jgi:DNA-binding transcriptional MerR regulator